MSKGKRYTQEFKIEAVKQITERGYSALDFCSLDFKKWSLALKNNNTQNLPELTERPTLR